MTDRFSTVVADVLDVPVGQLDDSLSPGRVEGWNSLRQMQIAAALQAAFTVRFTAREIRAARTVGAFRALVERQATEVRR